MTAHVLTKAVLAPKARGVGALLGESADVDNGHRLVWTLFPGATADTEAGDTVPRDFLFRKVDDRTFLIVSPQAPRDDHDLWHLGAKPYEPRPVEGERYSFILRANPAMAIKQRSGKSLRVDAIMHAKRLAKAAGDPWSREHEAAAALNWLFKREEALGVRFVREGCHATDYQQVTVARRGRAPVAFSTVDYEGLLTVADPAKLIASLTCGIGKARAFGCGLMLIRRAH